MIDVKKLADAFDVERVEIYENKVVLILNRESEFETEPKPSGNFVSYKKALTREGRLAMSRKRVKEPRIKAVLEANPNMTFKEWCEREYPNKSYENITVALRNHPNEALRVCIENHVGDSR